MAAKSLCKIEGCSKRVFGHGWCYAHYWRWYKHSDPLGGSTAKGAPGRYYIDTVLTYDGTDCLIWPFSRSGNGYGQMNVSNRKIDVHRRLCEDVNGPPPAPDYEAAHSCGQGHRGCVTKRHLSWKTRAANSADKIGHGTAPRGARAPSVKLTENDVREIRLLRGKMLQRDIANRYGVTLSNISAIFRGKSWQWLA